VTATIPNAQLTAITHCELAAIALDKAHHALQHPDLEYGGAVILAPSGRKHIAEIEQTLRAIHALLRPSDAPAHELSQPEPTSFS
jgi:hypothetical protein